MLGTTMPVELNEDIVVQLGDNALLPGNVVWTDGSRCGVKFLHPIDSHNVLVRTAAEHRRAQSRPPRLPIDIVALARSELGLRRVRIRDISLRGLKVQHDGGFTPGLRIKITLPSGIERRGIVRWTKDGIAGVLLTELFSTDELGDVDAL